MRVKIELDIDPEDLACTPERLKTLVQCWMHDAADATNEAIDPNTGDLAGCFSFTSADNNIRVAVEP